MSIQTYRIHLYPHTSGWVRYLTTIDYRVQMRCGRGLFRASYAETYLEELKKPTKASGPPGYKRDTLPLWQSDRSPRLYLRRLIISSSLRQKGTRKAVVMNSLSEVK